LHIANSNDTSVKGARARGESIVNVSGEKEEFGTRKNKSLLQTIDAITMITHPLVGQRKSGLPEHLATIADRVGTTVVRVRKLSRVKREEGQEAEVRRVGKENMDLVYS
jgi:hypothetical protein